MKDKDPKKNPKGDDKGGNPPKAPAASNKKDAAEEEIVAAPFVPGEDSGEEDDAETAEYAELLEMAAKKKIPDFESAEEINLVPYMDVMMNLVIFMMVATAIAAPLGIISIFPPPSSAGQGKSAKNDMEPTIPFTVAITEKGYMLKGDPDLGIAEGGAIPALIPKTQDGKFDFDTLNMHAVTAKDKKPAESQVIITSDGNVTYEVLVKTMDALRNKKDKMDQVLFDVVQLSPGII